MVVKGMRSSQLFSPKDYPHKTVHKMIFQLKSKCSLSKVEAISMVAANQNYPMHHTPLYD